VVSGGHGETEATSAQARAALLTLVAADGPSQVGSPRLTSAAWVELDRLAALHRLQPLLHCRTRERGDVPADLAAGWAEMRRSGAAMALLQRGELQRTVALLEAAGLRPVALKGAWLAWQVYPEPALRPLRDLDLLLPAEEAIPAFRLLEAHGYALLDRPDLSLEDILRLDKHMPPLRSPRGVTVELHHRLWEIDGRMDHAAPAAGEADFLARCRRVDGVLFPCPQDMLVHIIVHAAYDHRLDCGALVLSDIAYLVAKNEIDWPQFWREADERGFRRGAETLLTLVARHAPQLAIRFGDGAAVIPPSVLDAAVRLLFQDHETRQSAGVYATLRARGWRRFWQRLRARRGTATDATTTARDLTGAGGYLGWAASRLDRTLGHLLRGPALAQGRDLALMSRWLDGRG